MKVIFGGAFNPVTKAHTDVYHRVMKDIDASEFIYLPVSSAYTKRDLASNYHRLEMLKLAISPLDKAVVSELELEDNDFLGTYQSLIRFYDKEEEELAFIIGADNILDMETWINIEGILSEFKVIVLPRNNIDIYTKINEKDVLKKHRKSFIILKDFNVDISSTQFRNTWDKNQVDPNVFDYIIDHDLYRGENDV